MAEEHEEEEAQEKGENDVFEFSFVWKLTIPQNDKNLRFTETYAREETLSQLAVAYID